MSICHLPDFLCCFLEYSTHHSSTSKFFNGCACPLEENPNTGLKGFPGVGCIPPSTHARYPLHFPPGILAFLQLLRLSSDVLHTCPQAYWPPSGSSAPPGCHASELRMLFPPRLPHSHLQAVFLHSTSPPSSAPSLPHRPPPPSFCHFIVNLLASLYLCCLLRCNVRTTMFYPCCIPRALNNVCTQ